MSPLCSRSTRHCSHEWRAPASAANSPSAPSALYDPPGRPVVLVPRRRPGLPRREDDLAGGVRPVLFSSERADPLEIESANLSIRPARERHERLTESTTLPV